MSLARLNSVSEYLGRLNAAELAHDHLHVCRPDIVEGLRYATAADQQIATVEQAVSSYRSRAKSLYASSLRWKARGLMDRRADNLRTVADCRRGRDRFSFTLRRIVAERDQTSEVRHAG
jgi:hypothetical protein